MKIKLLLSVALVFFLGLFASPKENASTDKPNAISSEGKLICPLAKSPVKDGTTDEMAEVSPVASFLTWQI